MTAKIVRAQIPNRPEKTQRMTKYDAYFIHTYRLNLRQLNTHYVRLQILYDRNEKMNTNNTHTDIWPLTSFKYKFIISVENRQLRSRSM